MTISGVGVGLLLTLPLGAQSTFFGSLRSRVEVWDWWKGSGDSSYAFSGNALRFGFTYKKNRWDGLLEAEAPLLA